MDPLLVYNLDEEIIEIEKLKEFPLDFLSEKVVLGIDIYKYSEYQLAEQIYIPVLFDFLYQSTVITITTHEPFVFKPYTLDYSEFKKRFISTGDGGYQIFENPIEAIVFAIYFQMEVKRFNSGGSTLMRFKNLNNLIKSIELRYSITTDLLYEYETNFYGPAIINNSRILSKDRLNRLLIDKNTLDWLTRNINTPENLIDVDKSSFLLTNYFKTYDINLKSLIFDKKGSFISVDFLKIEVLKAKNTELSIFNLHIQVAMNIAIEKHMYNTYIITVGNLNTKGIE